MKNATKRLGLAVAVLGLVAGSAGQARAGLVVNGGFETGDFTGWTLSGNTGFTSIVSNPTMVHGGNYAAHFGAIGTPTDLTQSQNLATITGDSYTISFWLQNEGGSPNYFSASFGSDNLVTLTNENTFSYTQFSFTETATSSSTTLSFALQQNPSYWDLDDVSVTDLGPSVSGTDTAAAPEPSTIALIASALPVGLGYWLRRRRRAAA